MNNLKRELAPISTAAWSEIDAEATWLGCQDSDLGRLGQGPASSPLDHTPSNLERAVPPRGLR